jgi:mannose-6-phosphate isomerase-like protein (cupin superfamily)
MGGASNEPERFDFLGFRVRYLHSDRASACSLLEWHAPPGGGGPPVHVHDHTEEGFYVLRGQIALLVDDEELAGGPGSYTLVRPGQRDTFWNPGDQPADYLTLISPPGFEDYIRDLAHGLEQAQSEDEAAALRKRLGESYDVTVLGPPTPPA